MAQGGQLTVLVALGDAGRAERLAAALAETGDFVAIPAGKGDGGLADVVVTDGGVVDASTPHVLLSSRSGSEGGAAALATLPSNADEALIAAAIRLAAAGYRVSRDAGAPSEVHGRLLGDDAPGGDERHQEPAPSPKLSGREQEVLALLAEGAPNKVIARRLDISVHTAKFHVAAILTKLGAANRTDAIAIAMRQGLVLV
jgi:DNA-binding CsgD family transcriptional regulator